MTTIEVVLEQIRGYDLCPFVPALTTIEDLFCFKGLEDEQWARTNDSTGHQLLFIRSSLPPESQSSRGGREVLAGRINDDFFIDGRLLHRRTTSFSMDEIFNGRRVDQPWMGQEWIPQFYSVDSMQFYFNGFKPEDWIQVEFPVFKCGESVVFFMIVGCVCRNFE